jgi:integrase/recombinase XerD
MPLFQRKETKALVPVLPDGNAALIAMWLHGRPQTTQDAYSSDIARLLAFTDNKPLNTITLGDLQRFADSLADLSPWSQARILKACKSIMTFACKALPDFFKVNAGAALRMPKSKNTLAERILTEREVLLMIELEPDFRNRLILRLFYNAGIRRAELVTLCWRDIQDRPEAHTGQITVFGKGEKTRAIVLSPGIWHELMRYSTMVISEPQYLLFNLSASQIYRIVRAAATRAGIDKPVSPHWMRHAHASHALDRGAPISLVQATLGHESVQTTGKYLHARPGESSSKYLPD